MRVHNEGVLYWVNLCYEPFQNILNIVGISDGYKMNPLMLHFYTRRGSTSSNMCLELLGGAYRSSGSGGHVHQTAALPGCHSQAVDPSAEGACGSCSCPQGRRHCCSSRSR